MLLPRHSFACLENLEILIGADHNGLRRVVLAKFRGLDDEQEVRSSQLKTSGKAIKACKSDVRSASLTSSAKSIAHFIAEMFISLIVRTSG